MLVVEIAKKYKVTVSYTKVWYAKQKTVAAIYGDWAESYAQLPRLLLAFLQVDPNTRVSMKKGEPDPETGAVELERLFIAFGPSLQGFHHCRPVLSIDATHLYGRYKGKLLVALGVDGNGQIFPVAFGIVKEETSEDWGWFLLKLRRAIGVRQHVCIISDRHKGIISAVNNPRNGFAEPLSHHRFCLRHVRSNWQSHFKNATIKNMVYRIGSEIERRHFDSGMAELAILHPRGHSWLMQIPKEQWSLAYDGGYRYGCMTTNLVECFNGVLLSGRNLPICAMIRLIHRKLVNYFVEKRNNLNRMVVENPHGFTDRGVDLLEVSRRQSQHLHVAQVYDRGQGRAEVVSSLRNTQPVDLSQGKCGCGAWIQYKIPCAHAVKVCMALNAQYTMFVHEMYTLDAYRLTYAPQFQMLNNEDYWPSYDGPTVVPIKGTLRSKGRPRQRIHNEMDESTPSQTNVCGRCNQTGHTVRTCTNPEASSSNPNPARF